MFRWASRSGDQPSSGGMNASERAKVDHIVAMGFEESPALFALRQNEGSIDRAVDMLISGAAASGLRVDNGARDRAAQAAIERQSSRRSSSSKGSKGSTTFSKAMDATSSAAKAAAKVLKPRSFEQQLEGSLAKIADQPAAVDTLLYVIKTILENPTEKKYREIKTTNKRFRETIGSAGQSGIGFLEVVGFKKAGDWHVLRGQEDSAKLWLAKSALESVVENSPMYSIAKDRIAFEKALAESLSSANKEEIARRKVFDKGVPQEPELGRAGTTRITVFCGSSVLQRRFNSDDVVENILSWLGSTHSSLIPKRLGDESWELVDKTLYPPRIVDLKKDRSKTLQAAMMWPSAELVVQAAGSLERQQRHDEAGDPGNDIDK